MRVLQLGPQPPPHGGVQANLSAIRAALLMRGSSCPVIAIPRSQNASTDDPDVYRPQNALQLLWHLVRLRYDISHLHIGGNLTLRLLLLAMLCALMPRTKSVLSFHSGGYPSSPAGRAARSSSLYGFVLRRLDRIICVNAEIVEMFRKFGVPNERLRLIPPYSVTVASTNTHLPREIEDFLNSHYPVLLSVGLLEPEYDLPLQIDILGRVQERFPKAGLVMIGSGSLEDALRQKIEAKSSEDVMLCGDVDHAVTIRVIRESDLMLRTTVFDGDSISVREALYLGTPVIATDNGMRPAGVDLIPSSDPAALSHAIVNRLEDPTAFHSQGTGGEENVEAVLSLYEELARQT